MSDDWVDITTHGAAYQSQLNPSTGKYRHRWKDDLRNTFPPWEAGLSPKGNQQRRELTGPHPDPTEALLAKAAKVADLLWDEFCPGIRRTPEDDERYKSAALKVVEFLERTP